MGTLDSTTTTTAAGNGVDDARRPDTEYEMAGAL